MTTRKMMTNKAQAASAAAAKNLDLQDNLRPYQSYHVFKDPELSKSQWRAPLKGLLEEVFDLTKLTLGETITMIETPRVDQVPQAAEGLRLAWMTYTKELPVAWADPTAKIFDKENHIILVAAESQHVAISTSDKPLAGRLDRLASTGLTPALARLKKVDPKLLEAALVDGNARILWMSAIHRDQAIRPNAKVLIGSNLKASLDPLSEQTFHYTSVRSDGPAGAFGNAVPGVSPRKGRVWLGPTKKRLDHFTTRTQKLLELVEKAKAKATPFPVLAHAVADLAGVQEAFDYALVPPEAQSESSASFIRRFDRASEVTWTLKGKKTASDVDLETTFEGTKYKVELRLSPTDLKLAATLALPPPPTATAAAASALPEELAASLELFESDAMKIYYDSGHTYSSGAIYAVLTRPIAFEKFVDVDFTGAGYNIEEEKPTKPAATGTKRVADLTQVGQPGEKSLFSWAFHEYQKKKHKGWLWCDDGSGEIADFIHVGDTNNTLTLLHLKAAHSTTGDVAVGAFEVVCAQALKNVRMVEGKDIVEVLRDRLTKTPKTYTRCWHNGAVGKEPTFLQKIEKIPISQLVRRVVVVQPQVSLEKLPSTPAALAKNTTSVHRAKQLHTLLNGFAANFTNLGIQFEVIVSC